jgi:hypothetical protein
MKWLLILFATYMLVLPCIPCNAAEVCCVEESSCPADEHSCPEDAEHQHAATCPCCPSFSCNTCHSIVVSGLVLEDPVIPVRSFHNIPFADKPLAHFSAIIWQPPKALC